MYVGTIHPKHYDAVMMMFEAGKPVLCEKPLTMNASDTRKLIQAARDKGVFFMEVADKEWEGRECSTITLVNYMDNPLPN